MNTLTTTPDTAAPNPDTTGENAPREHVLALVEPSADGASTLELAHDVVRRGGRASIVMLITRRVDDDIREYAAAEGLGALEAESSAIERLTEYCLERVGAEVPTSVERLGWLGLDIRRHITEEITSVAVPEGVIARRSLDKMASKLGRPVVLAPNRAA